MYMHSIMPMVVIERGIIENGLHVTRDIILMICGKITGLLGPY